MLGISSPASDVEWRDDYDGENLNPWDAMHQEQHEGGAATGSAKDGKGGRAGGGGPSRGSLMGRGGRSGARRR